MCYDEENRERPIGVNEAKSAWLSQMTKYRDAMTNDVYSNGGLLDNTNKFGYTPVAPFNTGTIGRQILETEFTYEELSFISRCRLISMTPPDVDRLMSLIKKFKEKLIASQAHQDILQPPTYQTAPYFNTPYYGAAGNPWLNGGPSPVVETSDDKPRRGRKPKKKEDTEETTAVETEATSDEHNDQVDSLTESEKFMCAKQINNDSI